MLGALIGDLCGSIYEDSNYKEKPSTLLHPRCHFTDDSVLTSAVSSAFLKYWTNQQFSRIKYDDEYDHLLVQFAIDEILEFTKKYPWAGYGASFVKWIHSAQHLPYNSYGNGAAMRTSCCGWAARSQEEARRYGKNIASITHNHPDGIKSAVLISECIYVLKHNGSKKDVFNIASHYYNMDFSIAELHKTYRFDLSANGSVPQAIKCFLEGDSFEEILKLSISLGGDSDTISAISGSLAEIVYPIPDELIQFAIKRIPEDILYPVFKAEELWG